MNSPVPKGPILANSKPVVDMYPWRFIEELRKVPRFDHVDGDLDHSSIAAWRTVFESMLLFGHTRGYKLFSFDAFEEALRRALRQHKKSEEYLALFEDDAFKRRVKVWYESGMTETFVYACLVDALEDKTHEGLVFYDTRHDFKMKYDAAALVRGRMFVVNLFRGSSSLRDRTESAREVMERQAKINTMESAHWDNLERKRLSHIRMSCDGDVFDVNGVRLPGSRSVNAVLSWIYDGSGIENDKRFFYSDNRFKFGSAELPKTDGTAP